MEGETNSRRAPIILGRPFLKTVKTKINADDGTMSMKFGDIAARFNIFDAMKHPMEEHLVFKIELLFEKYFEFFSADFLSLYDFNDTYTCDACTDTHLCFICVEMDVTLHVDIILTLP